MTVTVAVSLKSTKFIILFRMNSETPDRDEAQGGAGKTKLRGVILLTDNREMGCGEKGGRENFRCSGFKCKLEVRQKLRWTRSSFKKTS